MLEAILFGVGVGVETGGWDEEARPTERWERNWLDWDVKQFSIPLNLLPGMRRSYTPPPVTHFLGYEWLFSMFIIVNILDLHMYEYEYVFDRPADTILI